MASVASRLAEARAQLIAAGLSPADAAFDAEVLARHLLDWDRAAVIIRAREPEPDGFPEAFARLVARRAAREPVALIVGRREFWGLDFEITPAVLIPRPETELIVEEAIAFARRSRVATVIDVGTGSGCLAVAIAHELPAVRVIATDTSAAALAVARRNAERNGVARRIEFREADLLDGIGEAADLMVSNPPYVPGAQAAELQPEVVRYEPHLALFGGPGGLEIVARLLAHAPARLAAGGQLVVEFGFGQHGEVARLAKTHGWRIVRVRSDLQSIPRIIVLSRTDHA